MGRQPQATQSRKAPSSESELTPFKVFGMYVDGAKWLLAIIAGLFVFGVESLKDRSGATADVWLFVAASIFLLAAGGLALIYLWKSYSYASHRVGSNPRGTAADNAYECASSVYPFMLGSFAVGMILFSLFGAANVWARLSAGKPVVVVAVDGGVVVAQRGDCMWVRNTSAGPQAKWTLIPAVAAPADRGKSAPKC